jgi:hypothetical protein
MEARNKLEVEAGLEEQKTILGWLVDMHRLLLSLPNNKFVAWTVILLKVLDQVSTNDPRVRNDPNNAETWRNVGGDTSRCRQLPAFSQFS